MREFNHTVVSGLILALAVIGAKALYDGYSPIPTQYVVYVPQPGYFVQGCNHPYGICSQAPVPYAYISTTMGRNVQR